jgi:hypothetical protein
VSLGFENGNGLTIVLSPTAEALVEIKRSGAVSRLYIGQPFSNDV